MRVRVCVCVRRSRCDCTCITRVERIRAYTCVFLRRERYVSSSSSSPSDRTTKRTRNKDGSRRETGAGPNASLPFFFSFFSFLSVPFFLSTDIKPAGEAKVPKGIPRRCSALRLVSSSLRAPLRLSLVPRVPGIPSSPSLPCPRALSFSLSLCSPACVCLYVYRMPATQK